MASSRTKGHDLALALAAGWGRLELRLDRALAAIVGISLAEYRLLLALADAPGHEASRIALADAVGLSASGVTRALRPLEKRRIIKTANSKHDARVALARLSDAGVELLSNATGVINDAMVSVLKHAPETKANQDLLVKVMTELYTGATAPRL